MGAHGNDCCSARHRPPAPYRCCGAAKPSGQLRPTPADPAPRSRPFVILDAAHGGNETGVGAFAYAAGEERSIWHWLAVCKKNWRRAGFPWCSPALPTICSPGISVRFRPIPHALRFTLRCIPPAADTECGCIRRWFPRRRPARRSQLFALGAGAVALPARSPAWRLRRWPPSVLRADCRCEARLPLAPLNNVTVAAIAVEIAPLGSSADELGSAEYQQKIAAARGFWLLPRSEGKLEVAQ